MAYKSRAQLDTELDELAVWVPSMMTETEEAFQIDAFAGRAAGIEAAASPDDHAHVWSRLQCILRDAGLIPRDEERSSD